MKCPMGTLAAALCVVLCVLLCPRVLTPAPDKGPEFGVAAESFDDFEDGKLAPYWKLDPDAKAELVRENATSGKSALKVTFAGERGALRYRRTGLDGYGSRYSRSLEVLGARFIFYSRFCFDVFNPAAENVNLETTFGVRTFSFALKPGPNTIVIPTEDIASGVYRMTQATHRIVFRVAKPEPTELIFDTFRLERETVGLNMARAAKCFDFGPDDMTRPGFTNVDSRTAYESARGYGWLKPNADGDENKLQTIASDGSIPLDDLLRDGVMNLSSPFIVDVPNGKYRVQLVGGWHWGGIYHLTPMDFDFTIKAEGEVKHLRLRAADPVERVKRYYGHDRTLYSFNEDVWTKFAAPVYGPVAFDVEVTDGQLNLEFASSPQPDKGFLNFLVMYPLDEAKSIEPEMSRLWYELRRRYDRVSFRKLDPALAVALRKPDLHEEFLDPLRRIEKTSILLARPEFSGRDFVVFARDHLDQVYPDTVPDPEEEISRLSVFSTPGEIAPVTFSLFPLRNVKSVRVEIDPLVGPGGRAIPPRNVDVRLARYSRRMVRSEHQGDWQYMVVPWYLVHFAAVDMERYLTRRFWINIDVPDDVAPGVYDGTVRVTGPDAAEIRLKLSLEVAPFRLRPSDVARFCTVFQVQPGDPGNEAWGYTVRLQNSMRLPSEHAREIQRQFEALHRQEIQASLETLRRYGFDTVFVHDWLKDVEEANLQLMSPLEIVPLNQAERDAEARPRDKEPKSPWVYVDRKMRRAYLYALESYDEEVIHGLHREGLQVFLGRPTGWSNLIDDPHVARFISGAYLWRSGADGVVIGPARHSWGDPYSPFDGFGGERGSLLMPSSKDWPEPNPSRILEETREGIKDYRYLLTLERLVRGAGDVEEARLAREFLDALRQELSGKLSDYVEGYTPQRQIPEQGWSAERYDRMRRDVARHIRLIQEALDRP